MRTTRGFNILERLLPNSIKTSIDVASNKRSYKQLRIILLTAMLSIAIGPLLIVAGLSYHYYKDLLQNSEREQLEWQLDGSIKSIDHMVDRLKSIVQFAARKDSYDVLVVEEDIETLLIRMQRQYSFFADLGVVDQNGIQQVYFGPYDLQGTDYSLEEWFKEVFDQGVHISRVYTGYRQSPHFSVAVSNGTPYTKKSWILRATIDAAKLQKFINTIKTNATDDLFLVDNEGILQTSSEFYGETLSPYNSDIVPGIHRNTTKDGEKIFEAIGRVDDTPWSLVILKKQYIHQADWKDFKDKLFIMVFSFIVIGVFVVYALVRILTGTIQKTDEMKIAMLKEAEQTDKLASIGRLAAGVGHEINNPLAIIDQKSGLIEDLLEMSNDFQHKPAILQNLQGVYKSVNRCKAITHRLLGFARRAEVKNEPIQLNVSISEVLQFLENAMVYNRITVDLQMQDNLPDVISDRLQLQQVFLNIINNAIDAIGRDGLVTITSHLVAGEVRIVVQDDGPGIANEILPHIFEPFYTTKETGKGTGLGLSITYGLIKKLGGDITVRSQIGSGTAFTITIPLHYEDMDDTKKE